MKKLIVFSVLGIFLTLLIISTWTPAQAALGGSKITSLVIQNASSSPVYIRFLGSVTRDFMLQTGKNVVQLPPGGYEYKYTSCGIQYLGKINLPHSAMRIPPCKTTKLLIKNFTLTEAPGTALTLRLNGPIKYYFVLTKPQEKLTIQQGTYDYVLRGCGKVIQSGRIKFDTAQLRWPIHCSP